MSLEAALALENVSHVFGATRALTDVSIQLKAGEVLCLVGPSGCGKTTLLRIAAGLEPIQMGRVSIGGKIVACESIDMPPERRGIGMVFQDYALFPHLTVAENIAFGLCRLHAAGRRARAMELLEQFHMADLADAYPHTLSGGQQQRVALARALAPKPAVIFLDEPFSGLDSRLRDRVRDETLHALKASRTATLLVTHDPEEAMLMGDRIALMHAGTVEQVGEPVALYLNPVTAFAATFFGEVNRLEGLVNSGHKVESPFGPLGAGNLAQGTPVEILIRPEALHIACETEATTTKSHAPAVMARVITARLLGRSTLVNLELHPPVGAAVRLHARVSRHAIFREGEAVTLTLDPSQAFVFAKTGNRPG